MKTKLSYITLGLMVLASILGMTLRPTHKMASENAKIQLEQLIPHNFANWHMEDAVAQLVNPQTEAAINQIYAQTLSRTYVNDKGERIMLSIAYGEDQSDSVGAHLPEGCYGGQGFTISNIARTHLSTPSSSTAPRSEIPVTRLMAVKGNRIEPITYFLRTGHEVAYPDWDTKLVKMKYALQGSIPDGLLVRVSNLVESNDYAESTRAYALQAQFIAEMLKALSPSYQLQMVGDSTKR
ncbi:MULTISPECIES: exosortase-associated protein EpsI, B-type [Methylotenera]|uniref:exosortase-associated protein EpsI, B-type n=1 Tax=Methylotenera TaxID=359407 RepID=UPI00037D391C|nr:MULTISPECIES: exosortase-associated protein EpsI, B-type [Methylotenera]